MAPILELWEAAGLWSTIETLINTVLNFNDFILTAFRSQSQQIVIVIIMMLWCLWRRRNEKLWEDKEHQIQVSIQQARDQIMQWQLARNDETEARPRDCDISSSRWQPPSAGVLKCNVEVAIFWELNRYGVGMCIRNNKGQFIKANTMWFEGSPPA
jgi:hypothetical protein